eukprot:3837829-Pleurochrysis_carterae.AAC.1
MPAVFSAIRLAGWPHHLRGIHAASPSRLVFISVVVHSTPRASLLPAPCHPSGPHHHHHVGEGARTIPLSWLLEHSVVHASACPTRACVHARTAPCMLPLRPASGSVTVSRPLHSVLARARERSKRQLCHWQLAPSWCAGTATANCRLAILCYVLWLSSVTSLGERAALALCCNTQRSAVMKASTYQFWSHQALRCRRGPTSSGCNCGVRVNCAAEVLLTLICEKLYFLSSAMIAVRRSAVCR